MKNREEIVEDIIKETTTNIPQITSYKTGGVFRLFVEVIASFLEKIYTDLEALLPNRFIKTATGTWLDLKAEEISLYRYAASKTVGWVHFYREDSDKDVSIPKGKILASKQGLRYVIMEDCVMPSGATSLSVLVEAEDVGSQYNVASNQITEFITPISGVDSVINDNNPWTVELGTDEESDESLRSRCLSSWAGINGSNVDAYIHWVKSIEGIGDVYIMPTYRGVGTVDIYCIGIDNITPSVDLLMKVRDYVDERKPIATSIVVLAGIRMATNLNISVVTNPAYTVTEEQITESIDSFFKDIKMGVDFESSALISHLFSIEGIKSITVNTPQRTSIPDGCVAVLNTLTLDITTSSEY